MINLKINQRFIRVLFAKKKNIFIAALHNTGK